MIKPSAANLRKLEDLFKDLGYKIIYEKGHFNSGYCIVNDKKIIVVNKFFKRDARFNCLNDILNKISPNVDALPEESSSFFTQLMLNKKTA